MLYAVKLIMCRLIGSILLNIVQKNVGISVRQFTKLVRLAANPLNHIKVLTKLIVLAIVFPTLKENLLTLGKMANLLKETGRVKV